MKIYLTILLSLLLVPVFAFASNYNDVTVSGSTVINIRGYDFVVSGTAYFDTITVDTNSFTVDMSQNATLVVTSADKWGFGVVPPDYKKSFTCGSGNSVLTLANEYWDNTTAVTVTLGSICSSGSTGSTGSGGGGMIIGGGGGGGSTAPTVPQQVAQAPVSTPVTVKVSVSPVFTTLLKPGSSGNDVKRLQQILNSSSDTQIATSGVGSPENETTYFGSATKAALQKFQSKYGIISSGSPETTGYGSLGPKTRAKLAEVFAMAQPAAPSVAQLSPVAVSVSPVFSSGLSRGMTSSDVKRLQQLLNSDPDTKIAASGIGSPGNETEYLGSLTEKAIQKFQVKYGIAKEGDSGYGYVGPKTRAKIQEVFKQQ